MDIFGFVYWQTVLFTALNVTNRLNKCHFCALRKIKNLQSNTTYILNQMHRLRVSD
jgi:hypothetical protein